MATFTKFYEFHKAVYEGKHNFASDQIRVALCNAANAPVVTNSVLADLTVVSLANLAGAVVTTMSSTQTLGVYKLTLTDKTLLADGGPVGAFQMIVLYNDTATNKDLMGWIDRGSETTLLDTDTIIVDFSDANGLFTNT